MMDTEWTTEKAANLQKTSLHFRHLAKDELDIINFTIALEKEQAQKVKSCKQQIDRLEKALEESQQLLDNGASKITQEERKKLLDKFKKSQTRVKTIQKRIIDLEATLPEDISTNLLSKQDIHLSVQAFLSGESVRQLRAIVDKDMLAMRTNVNIADIEKKLQTKQQELERWENIIAEDKKDNGLNEKKLRNCKVRLTVIEKNKKNAESKLRQYKKEKVALEAKKRKCEEEQGKLREKQEECAKTLQDEMAKYREIKFRLGSCGPGVPCGAYIYRNDKAVAKAGSSHHGVHLYVLNSNNGEEVHNFVYNSAASNKVMDSMSLCLEKLHNDKLYKDYIFLAISSVDCIGAIREDHPKRKRLNRAFAAIGSKKFSSLKQNHSWIFAKGPGIKEGLYECSAANAAGTSIKRDITIKEVAARLQSNYQKKTQALSGNIKDKRNKILQYNQAIRTVEGGCNVEKGSIKQAKEQEELVNRKIQDASGSVEKYRKTIDSFERSAELCRSEIQEINRQLKKMRGTLQENQATPLSKKQLSTDNPVQTDKIMSLIKDELLALEPAKKELQACQVEIEHYGYDLHQEKFVEEAKPFRVLDQKKIIKEKERLENELETARSTLYRIQANENTLLETMVLCKDSVLSGYIVNPSDHLRMRCAIAILQVVFKRFPLFSFDQINGEFCPDFLRQHAQDLLKAAGYPDSNEIDQEFIERITKTINKKYQYDEVCLSIIFSERDRQISFEVEGHTQQVELYHAQYNFMQSDNTVVEKDDIIVLAPVDYAYSPNEQFAQIIKTLITKKDLLIQFAQSRFFYRHGVSLKEVPDDELEKLLLFLQEEKKETASISSFSEFNDFLKKNPCSSFSLSVLCMMVSKLVELETISIKAKNTYMPYFLRFKAAYLSVLTDTMSHELNKRNSAVAIEMNGGALNKLEEIIKATQREVIKNEKLKVEKQRQLMEGEKELETLLSYTNDIDKSYKSQINKSNNTIELLKQKIKHNLAKITELKKKQENKQAQVAGTQKQRQQLREQKRQLAQAREELESECRQLHTELNQLVENKEKLCTEKDNADTKLKVMKQQKQESDEELNRMKVLCNFVSEIQKVFTENPELFQMRKAFQEKYEMAVQEGCFSVLYDFIIENDHFKHLASPEIRTILDEDVKNKLYFYNCVDAIDEVVGSGEAMLDTLNHKFTYQGFNLSWKDCYERFCEQVKDQLALYGLPIVNNKVALLSSGHTLINYLPTRLREFIIQRVQETFEPSKFYDEEGNLTWSQITTNSSKDFADTINHLSLSFEELVSLIVDSVDLIASNDIYIDEDVYLPGICINLYANKNIVLKENCHINTSHLNRKGFVHTRAPDGSYFRSNEDEPIGQPGASGLSGFSGGNAGHITLEAGIRIIHIDTLHCQANGGDGAGGQCGGNGDKGKTCNTVTDKISSHSPTVNKGNYFSTGGNNSAHAIVIEARIPGIGENGDEIKEEKSGSGGSGGKAGWGGEGGFPGDVLIKQHDQIIVDVCHNPQATSKIIEPVFQGLLCLNRGGNGQDAAKIAHGGPPGEPGYQGLSVARQKKSHRGRGIRGTGIGKKFTKEWRVHSEEGYFLMDELKHFLDKPIASFGGRVFKRHYVETKLGKDFYRAFDIDGNVVIPRREGTPIRSTHERSLGEDKSEEIEKKMCPEHHKHVSCYRYNLAKDNAYQQSIRYQVQRGFQPQTVNKMKKRTEEASEALSNEVLGLTTSIKQTKQTVRNKEEQLQELNDDINEKQQLRNTKQAKIDLLRDQINDLEDQQHELASHIFADLNKIDAITNTIQQHSQDKHSCQLDIILEEKLQERFLKLKKQLIKTVNASLAKKKEQKSDNEATEKKLTKKLTQLREQLEQLEEEYQRSEENQKKKYNKQQRMTAILSQLEQQKKQVETVNKNTQVAIAVEPTDKNASTHYKSKLNNYSPVVNYQSEKTEENYAKELQHLYHQCCSGNRPSNTTKDPVKLLALLSNDTVLLSKNNQNIVKDFFSTLQAWLEKHKSTDQQYIVALWKELYYCANIININQPELANNLASQFFSLSFQLQNKSNQALQAYLMKETNVEQLGITLEELQQQIQSIVNKINQYFYINTCQQQASLHDQLKLKHVFYQWLLMDTIDRDKLPAEQKLVKLLQEEGESLSALNYTFEMVNKMLLLPCALDSNQKVELEFLQELAKLLHIKYTKMDNNIALYALICRELIAMEQWVPSWGDLIDKDTKEGLDENITQHPFTQVVLTRLNKILSSPLSTTLEEAYLSQKRFLQPILALIAEMYAQMLLYKTTIDIMKNTSLELEQFTSQLFGLLSKLTEVYDAKFCYTSKAFKWCRDLFDRLDLSQTQYWDCLVFLMQQQLSHNANERFITSLIFERIDVFILYNANPKHAYQYLLYLSQFSGTTTRLIFQQIVIAYFDNLKNKLQKNTKFSTISTVLTQCQNLFFITDDADKIIVQFEQLLSLEKAIIKCISTDYTLEESHAKVMSKKHELTIQKKQWLCSEFCISFPSKDYFCHLIIEAKSMVEKNISLTNLTQFFGDYLLCLSHSDVKKVNVVQLAVVISQLEMVVLQKGNRANQAVWLDFCNQINDYIDNYCFSLLSELTIKWQNALQSHDSKWHIKPEEIARFSYFYRYESGTVNSDKKAFIQFLLVKSRESGLDTSNFNYHHELIQKLNEKSLRALKFDSSRTELQELVICIESGYNNSQAVFKVWSNIVANYHSQLAQKKMKLWHFFFLHLSIKLFDAILFDDVEQKEINYWYVQLSKQTKVFMGKPRCKKDLELHLQLIERLKLSAYGYHGYKYARQLLRTFESAHTKQGLSDALIQLQTTTFEKLKKVCLTERLCGSKQSNRVYLFESIINHKFRVDAKTHIEKVESSIDKFMKDLLGDMNEKPSAKQLIEFCVKAQRQKYIQQQRLLYARVFCVLLKHPLKKEVLIDFSSWLLENVSLPDLLLSDIYQIIAQQLYEYLDKDQLCLLPIAYRQIDQLLQNTAKQGFVVIYSLYQYPDIKDREKLVNQVLQCFNLCENNLSDYYQQWLNSISQTELALENLSQYGMLLDCLVSLSEFELDIVDSSILSLCDDDSDIPLNDTKKVMLAKACVRFCQQRIACNYSNQVVVAQINRYFDQLLKSILHDSVEKDTILTTLQDSYGIFKALDFSSTNNILLINKLLPCAKSINFAEKILLPFQQQLYLLIKPETGQHILSKYDLTEWTARLKYAYWKEYIVERCLYDPLLIQLELNQEVKPKLQLFLQTDNYDVLQETYFSLMDVLQNTLLTSLYKRSQELLNIIKAMKEKILISYSIALADKKEAQWFSLMTALIIRQQESAASIADVVQVVNLMNYFNDIEKCTALIKKSSIKYVTQLLYIELISQELQGYAIPDVVIKEYMLPFGDSVFSNGAGLDFLNVFYSALRALKGQQLAFFSEKDFIFLTTSLISLNVHNRQLLVDGLKECSLPYWTLVIERHTLANQLKLNLDNQSHQNLLDILIQLKVENNKPLWERWLDLVVKREAEHHQLDDLVAVFENFYYYKWPYNDAAIAIIENQPSTKWKIILQNHFALALQKELAAHQQDKEVKQYSISQIAEQMKQRDENMSSVTVLLQSDKPLLEELVNRIKSCHDQKYKSFTKKDIQKYVKEHFLFTTENQKSFLTKLFDSNYEQLINFMAIVFQAMKEANGILLYNAQFAAILSFIFALEQKQSRLANMYAGQGKSYLFQILAITAALSGETVEIITSSKALAVPDAEKAKEIFSYFNLKCHNACDRACEENNALRKRRYEDNHVIYNDIQTSMRDALLATYFEKNLRSKSVTLCLVDEVDRILDEFSNVLYISHSVRDLKSVKRVFELIWQCVHAPDAQRFSQEGLQQIQKLYDKKREDGDIVFPDYLGSFIGDFIKSKFEIWVRNAYLAKDMRVDHAYSILQQGKYRNKIIINDLPTGVEQFYSQWCHLHPFLQLKHQKEVSLPSMRAIFMSPFTYFKQFSAGHFFGMSGTLGGNAERDLYQSLFNVDFLHIPWFTKNYYYQEPGIVVTQENWYTKIYQEIKIKTVDCLTKNAIERQAQYETYVEELHEAIKSVNNLLTQLERREEKLSRDHDNITEEIQTLLMKISNITINQLPDKSNESNEKNEQEYYQQKFNSEERQKQHKMKNSKAALQRDKLISMKSEKEKLLSKTKKSLEDIDKEKKKLQGDKSSKLAEQQNLQSLLQGRGGRPILIVCPDKKVARELESYLSDRLKDYLKEEMINIYRYDSYLDDLKKIMKTEELQPGDILVSTNIAGRGKDFKLSNQSKLNGGLLVLMTFIPKASRTREQAFRRAARNNDPGSGKYIVFDERKNTKPISVTQIIEELNCLEKSRLEKIGKEVKPKIDCEQKLLDQFKQLSEEVIKILKENNYSKIEAIQNRSCFSRRKHTYEKQFIDLQIKSLRNRWAFWLQKNEDLIKNVWKDKDNKVFHAFAQFEKDVYSVLASDRYGLITEPAELILLGRYYMEERPEDAIYCFNRVIERDPYNCAFAYYYRAQSWIKMSFDDEYKRKARADLKQATELFTQRINELTDSAQVVSLVAQHRRRLGYGLSEDAFSAACSDEIYVLNIHLQAANFALGTSLKEQQFQQSSDDTDYAKVLFRNIQQHLPEHVKGYRINKKITKKEQQLYYKKNRIIFPYAFDSVKQQIITCLLRHCSEKRAIKKKDLEPYVFCKEQWQNLLLQKKYLEEQQVVLVGEKFQEPVLGDEVYLSLSFTDCAKDILDFCRAYKSRLPKQKFIQALKNYTGNNTLDFDEIYKILIDKKCIKISNAYVYAQSLRQIIDVYVQQIRFDHSKIEELRTILNDLPLSSVKTLAPFSKMITTILNQALQENKLALCFSDFQQEEHSLTKDAYLDLFLLLHSLGILIYDLNKQLKIDSLADHFSRLFEENILLTYRDETFLLSDIELPENNDDALTSLWQQLEQQKVILSPKIHPIATTSDEKYIENRLQMIKDDVWGKIKLLANDVPGITEEVWQKYAAYEEAVRKKAEIDEKSKKETDSSDHKESSHSKKQKVELPPIPEELVAIRDIINQTFERSIGTIRRIPKIEIENVNLANYFNSETGIPPIVLEYMEMQCNSVINVIKYKPPKGSWLSRDALTCIVIGATQIAVGMLIVYSCPALAVLGEALIQQGIGDIMFAVSASIEGNFSWEAYRQYKRQSVAVTVITMGISATFFQCKPDVSKLGQRVLTQFVETAKNMVKDKLMALAIEELIKVLINQLVNNFRSKFKASVRHKAGKNIDRLRNGFTVLYEKMGHKEASLLIEKIIGDPSLQHFIDKILQKEMMQISMAVSDTLAGIKKPNTREMEALNNIIDASKAVSTILHSTAYIRSIDNIMVSTSQLFSLYAEAVNKHCIKYQSETSVEVDEKQIKQWVDEKINSTVDAVLNNVQARVEKCLANLRGAKAIADSCSFCFSYVKERLSHSQEAMKNEIKRIEAEQEEQFNTNHSHTVEDLKVTKEDFATHDKIEDQSNVISNDEADNLPSDTKIKTSEGDKKISEINKQDSRSKIIKTGDQYYEMPENFSNTSGGSVELLSPADLLQLENETASDSIKLLSPADLLQPESDTVSFQDPAVLVSFSMESENQSKDQPKWISDVMKDSKEYSGGKVTQKLTLVDTRLQLINKSVGVGELGEITFTTNVAQAKAEVSMTRGRNEFGFSANAGVSAANVSIKFEATPICAIGYCVVPEGSVDFDLGYGMSLGAHYKNDPIRGISLEGNFSPPSPIPAKVKISYKFSFKKEEPVSIQISKAIDPSELPLYQGDLVEGSCFMPRQTGTTMIYNAERCEVAKQAQMRLDTGKIYQPGLVHGSCYIPEFFGSALIHDAERCERARQRSLDYGLSEAFKVKQPLYPSANRHRMNETVIIPSSPFNGSIITIHEMPHPGLRLFDSRHQTNRNDDTNETKKHSLTKQ